MAFPVISIIFCKVICELFYSDPSTRFGLGWLCIRLGSEESILLLAISIYVPALMWPWFPPFYICAKFPAVGAVVLNLLVRYYELFGSTIDVWLELRLPSPLGGWKKVLPNFSLLFSFLFIFFEPGRFLTWGFCTPRFSYGVRVCWFVSIWFETAIWALLYCSINWAGLFYPVS